ncbi:hypothetical protein BMETH_3646170493, partial [methanotrophic bacterial endosymbiont of Bathymodiolus sp.]
MVRLILLSVQGVQNLKNYSITFI